LIRRLKQDRNYVEELRARESHQESRLQLTYDTIAELEPRGIWTTKQVSKAVRE